MGQRGECGLASPVSISNGVAPVGANSEHARGASPAAGAGFSGVKIFDRAQRVRVCKKTIALKVN
jgi:hypothetical protein